MSLTDLIDKLINEYGSFREHLELLREQGAMLEKENSALKKEHGAFKEHLEPLREQISRLERENGALKKEHGSFKEHLELLKEQLSVLEKENGALKSENAILKGKKDTIKPKLDKTTSEMERPNEVIKVSKKVGEEPRLDAGTEKVLKLFFDTGQELSVNQVAGKLSINVNTAQNHLDLLSKAKLIVQTTTDDSSSRGAGSGPALFELSFSGRKYVIENKIVT